MEEFKIENLFALSGHPGVYRAFNRLKNGNIIFEHLLDMTRLQVDPKKSNITQFGNVFVYTNVGNISLEKIFEQLSEIEESVPIYTSDEFSKINPDKQREFMESVVPGYDKQKFKPYHMQKILAWYADISKAADMLSQGYIVDEEE